MDFEIEEESGEFTPYGRDPYSFKSSGNSKPGAKKSGLFGGGNSYDDEDAYDFQYDAEQDYGKKSTSKSADPVPIPAFSPRPEQGKHQPQVQRQDMSALDRAKEMLQKYNKPAGGLASSSQSASNKYKTGRASLSFDEDELSGEEEEEESEDQGEYGDLSISSPGTSMKNFKPKAQAGAPMVPPKPTVSSSASSNKPSSTQSTSAVSKPPAATNSSNNKPTYTSSSANTKSTAVKTIQELDESIEEDEYEDDHEEEEESVAASADEDEEDDDYDNEEFDEIDEDVEDSDDKPVTKNKTTKGRSDSEASDQDNASYSRMVYGQDEEEEEESLEESKPKILSFADLADLSGWDAPNLPTTITQPTVAVSITAPLTSKPVASANNIATISAPVVPIVSTNKPPANTNTNNYFPTSATVVKKTAAAPTPVAAPVVASKPEPVSVPVTAPAATYSYPTSFAKEQAVAAATVPTKQSAPNNVPLKVDVSAPVAPTPSAISPPITNAPTTATYDPATQSTQPPPPPPQAYGYPGYPPYPYPGYPPTSASPSESHPPPSPPHAPYYMPYGAPSPYGYNMPPHPMMMSYGGYPNPYAPYGGNAYPGYGYPPPAAAAHNHMMQQSQLLGRNSMMAASSSMMGLGGLLHPHHMSMESETSQRVIMELLTEYNKVKDEAEWSKKKLAEVIVMMDHQQQSSNNNNDNNNNNNNNNNNTNSNNNGNTRQNNAKEMLTQDDDVDESAVEYSMDFVEVSQIQGFTVNTNGDNSNNAPAPSSSVPSSSWAPLQLRNSEPSLSNVLQGKTTPSTKNGSANNAGADRYQSQFVRDSNTSLYSQPLQPISSTSNNNTNGLNNNYHPTKSMMTEKENEAPIPSTTSGFPFSSTASAANPFGADALSESVAKSFLASQELLRSKFEALRMKIQLSSSMHRSIREFEDLQSQRTRSNDDNEYNRDKLSASQPYFSTAGTLAGSRPVASSLESFKADAQRRRDEDARRLFGVLREKYPELKPAEVLEMVNKFGSM